MYVDLLKLQLFYVSIMAMLFQLTSLGADELKIAELVGVQPGVLSKKATGLAVKMVSMMFHRNFVNRCNYRILK